MTINKKYLILLIASIAALIIGFFRITGNIPDIREINNTGRAPIIFPDYSQTVIPPNIAPLNFIVKENGKKYYIKIFSARGDTIRIFNKNRKVKIHPAKWKKLLNQNKGEYLHFEIYTREGKGKWSKYELVSNKIANEEIDGYLVYRLINPGYILWDELGIYCRNVQNFNEKPVLVNNLADGDCMNCHSFCKNDPGKMIFHVRGDLDGTLLTRGDKLKKINTRTGYTMSAGTYPSWHPGGRLIAFSVNIIMQQFHATGKEKIEVYDRASDIILYDTESNIITTSPVVSTKKRETMPTWSPDGKYLYYCSAPEFENNLRYDSVRYDLVRISYNAESNIWGKPDTILTSHETGLSITWPRISPDGRYLLFCMADHGYFSIHYPSSDLYIMDLETGKYNRLDINSDHVESYHSWSANGRWFVFAGKKLNGLCSRPYFAYFDYEGRVYKPFILPQKDPDFYDTFLRNYNVPELVSGPVKLNKWYLRKTVNGQAIDAEFDKNVDLDALSGATRMELYTHD
ncbi:MAG: PD40 domain-containing protein [Bacteroidales bacterium]|nr:MAG: PD40 domain-containing protein [Bacteroidales bacterium]